MKEARVRSVRHVAVRVPRVEETSSFLENTWGLIPTAEDGGFRGTADGRPLIKVSEGSKRGIDHLSFTAASEAAVDKIADRVHRLGLRVVEEPGLDGDGAYRMRCRDAQGLLVEVARAVPTPAEKVPRGSFTDRPMLISHVVINTPDLEETSSLYCELFGFDISDRFGDFMTFLRCNRFHHSLAFSQADHTSLNHIAFETGSLDAVMRSNSRMTSGGRPPIWGPGRHGPGDNVFAYFVEPSGLLVEYTSALEVFDEADPREARVWPMDDPEVDNLWGTGGPSDDAAEVMWGEPDPYLRT